MTDSRKRLKSAESRDGSLTKCVGLLCDDDANVSQAREKAMQSFRVREGISVEVCKANNRSEWFAHVTTKESVFSEPVSRSRSVIVFRRGPWMLRVKPHNVEMYNGIRWMRLK